MAVGGAVQAVVVKDELVRREIGLARAALDALGARAVVAGRYEIPFATPSARVPDLQIAKEKKKYLQRQ